MYKNGQNYIPMYSVDIWNTANSSKDPILCIQLSTG
jgi:hypothetical protein